MQMPPLDPDILRRRGEIVAALQAIVPGEGVIDDLEGMRRFIGADSLAFLSVEGIYRAMGYEQRDPLRPQFTDHCFTGDYPTALTDQSGREASPRQLSLLAEAS